jgi:hypothetical protein
MAYRYPPSSLDREPDLEAETIYVAGGRYGNVEALDRLRALVDADPGAVLAFAPLSAALVQALVFWPAFALDPARLTDGYEAALHGGLAHTGPIHPGLRLLAPEADAIVRELPLFQFTTPGDLAVGAGCTLHLVDDRGRVLFASFEELGTNLAGEVRLPVRVWNAIAPGTTVRWRVRRIPNRAHHEGWRAMPTSEWRSFVRQR